MGAPFLIAAALLGAGVGWVAAWYLGRARLERRMAELNRLNGADRDVLERDLRAAEQLAEALRDEIAKQSRTIHRMDAQIAQSMVRLVDLERMLAIRNADVGELRAAYENLSGELTQTRARLWDRDGSGPNLARGTGDQARHLPPSIKKIETLPSAAGRRDMISPPRKKL
jgi:septal ring factor EnvC (AmiA/AmiB activator)